MQFENRGAMQVGHIAELWRYPVKSMGGERIEKATLSPVHGLLGDRAWAVRDESVGEIRGAKQIHDLLLCDARYVKEPTSAEPAPVELTLPGGTQLRSGDEGVDTRLSAALGRSLSLQARQPADALDHYRRREAIEGEAGLRAQLGLLPDEPLPDMSGWSEELTEFTSPPGTYFDSFELHLLTTASLATLARHTPDSGVDVRRFRPNLLIESQGAAGLPEIDWAGCVLTIGESRIEIVMPMVRCVMTTCAQPGLPKSPEIMRSLVRETGQDLGVGARVRTGGEVRVGDAVHLHPS